MEPSEHWAGAASSLRGAASGAPSEASGAPGVALSLPGVASGSPGTPSELPRADAGRIAADIDALRARTLPERPFTRRAFTSIYAEGRRWLARAMSDAGLQPRIDAAGNLVGGSNPAAGRSVLIGSHIDTVPDGGAYDGVAGVVAGLEVARMVREAAIELPFSLEVVDFLSEEPSEFGVSCIGSRAMVGALSGDELARRDAAGRSLAEAIRDVGGRPEALGRPLRDPRTLLAYLELHIEQGPLLERAGATLGVVSGIVGIRRYELRIVGIASHAGTTAMEDRRDALAGAAEVVLAVERLARSRARTERFVGTVGRLALAPGAPNVIPGEARLTVELRALTDEALDLAASELAAGARELTAARGLELAFEEVSRTAPVELDGELRALLARTAGAVGVAALELASGGGHDAGHLASLGPAAMLFVPCRDGLSHAPGETADPADIAAGATVLLGAVLELAARAGDPEPAAGAASTTGPGPAAGLRR